MKKRSVVRSLLLILLDAAMVWMEWRTLSALWRSSGAGMLRYYTQDSNILAMVLCAASLICTLAALLTGREKCRSWAKGMHHIAASCLMVTFLVSALVLVPAQSYGSWHRYKWEFGRFMLQGKMLYLHTVCPLLMFGGFLILEEPVHLTIGNVLKPMLPVTAYGAVTLLMNIAGVYSGPYFFFEVHKQPWYMTVMWMCAIVVGAFLISGALALLSRIKRKNSDNP